MMEGDEFQKLGAIESPGGDLVDIFRRMNDSSPMSMRDVQGFYTELGQKMAKGNIPGDIYSAYKQARGDLGSLLQGQYTAEGKGPQWEDAQANWSRLARTWWNPDSPLAQSMKARDATAVLKPLLGDQSERATKYLQDYSSHGADPNIVKAASNFYRGVDRMQFRGMWRAAGPLMIAAPLGMAAGIPYSDTMAGIIAPLIAAKMGLGWMETRPSMTDILAGVPPKVAGEPWIPRTSPFQPYRPGNPLLVPAGKIPTP
jgi:hypothetical protein